ncbi:MAG: hypothetical protein ACU0CT_01885 [Paracoccaceae bacterium]
MDDEGDEQSKGFGLLGDDQYSEVAPNRRAAVIVGVGTSAGLPCLTSAGPMARCLGDWLSTTSPGYDVTVITDEEGHEVTRAEIFKAIRAYVTVPVRYELLLVHYIGHGLYQARNDIWMLSDLPVDRAACVSLTATLNDAKFSGIPNVVVVSDACRVLPGEVVLSEVDPSSVIPQHPEFPIETSCVDYFQATGRGTPAFEGEIDGVRRSFLSHAFREAYRHPRPEMVREMVLADGATIRVVPNRQLGGFLKAEVMRALGASDAAKSQVVVPVVPSGDTIFIAQVDAVEAIGAEELVGAEPPSPQIEVLPKSSITPDKKTRGTMRKTKPRPSGISTQSRKDTGGDGNMSGGIFAPPRETLYRETEVARLLRRARRADWPEGQDPRLHFAPPSGSAALAVTDFETQTALTLTGAAIARAAMTSWPLTGSRAEPAPEKGRDGLSVLRLYPNAGPVGELALALDDGRCLLLPVMEGYICHAAIDATGLRSLAFVPGRSNWRHDATDPARVSQIERLRALANEAMDQNRFQVGSTEEAGRLADAIRMGKASDPVLGLFAAQAYAEAAMPERVSSVSDYMHRDIRADLFDVRLLSNRFWQESSDFPVVPRCPMLTQNWALLGPRRASLPDPLARLQPFLTDALWTSFAPGAADYLFDAIEKENL